MRAVTSWCGWASGPCGRGANVAARMGRRGRQTENTTAMDLMKECETDHRTPLTPETSSNQSCPSDASRVESASAPQDGVLMGRVGHVPRRATELSVLRSAGSWSSRRGSSVVELVVVVGCAESVVVVFSANKCNGGARKTAGRRGGRDGGPGAA
ncbi:hypothetical protein B0H14DRAFT_2961927 [Mycena olivaceomarginata]|nr:hypothetical protein B0H14DRAFT_2961927 [Mycena olivaceomarginata]